MTVDRKDGQKVVALTGTRARPRVELHRLDALPRQEPREEIVEGMFAPGELVALIGAPGGGKSAVATLLATCVAEGRPFLGRQVLQGPAVYIAAERFREVIRRLTATRKKPAPVYVANARPELANAAVAEALGAEVAALCEVERSCPSLVIIDTLARAIPGLDENSARDAGLVIEGLSRLAAACPSAAVLFVHHVGKQGMSMRGSSALLGGVDLQLTVTGDGRSKRLSVTKANAVPEGQQLRFSLQPAEVAAAPGLPPETVITATAISETATVADGPLSARASALLKLIEAQPSPADRQVCLAIARAQGVVSGISDASTSEQFRKALIEIRDSGCCKLRFDSKSISLGTPQ